MDATRVILRHDESTTVLDALLASSSGAEVGAEALVARADAGEVVDIDGRPVALDALSSRRNVAVFFYRDLPVETPIPFDLEILYDDENLVVVDKPHFLATMPAGATSPRPHLCACGVSWATMPSHPSTGSTG